MRATRSEQALRRVLAWLSWSGRELTPQLEQAALQALAEAIAAGETDLFGACLYRLQCGDPALAGTTCHCPQITPPLRRSSIRYGQY